MDLGKRKGLQKSMRKLLGEMCMFTLLNVMMVSRMYMSKHQIAHYKHVQVIVVNCNSIVISRIHSRKVFK